jgi:hypothetical protein
VLTVGTFSGSLIATRTVTVAEALGARCIDRAVDERNAEETGLARLAVKALCVCTAVTGSTAVARGRVAVRVNHAVAVARTRETSPATKRVAEVTGSASVAVVANSMIAAGRANTADDVAVLSVAVTLAS